MVEERDLTLKDANYQVECWKNDLTRFLNEKEALKVLIDMYETSFNKVIVDGGKKEELILKYLMLKEQLDLKIQRLQDKIKGNLDWIDDQLRRQEKYEKIEKLILNYKEILPGGYSWDMIASLVHYSKRQCIRIYRRHRGKRDVC